MLNSSWLKTASAGGVSVPVNCPSIASGMCGVGVMVGVLVSDGVSVTVGESVMLGITEMVGVRVMEGVIVGVGEGVKKLYATGSANELSAQASPPKNKAIKIRRHP